MLRDTKPPISLSTLFLITVINILLQNVDTVSEYALYKIYIGLYHSVCVYVHTVETVVRSFSLFRCTFYWVNERARTVCNLYPFVLSVKV